MSETGVPGVTGSKPELAGSDGLEERGQGAGRLLDKGGELAFLDAENAVEDGLDAVATVDRDTVERPDTD